MSNKFLLGICLAFSAIFIFGLAAVVGVNSSTTPGFTEHTTMKTSPPSEPASPQPSSAATLPTPETDANSEPKVSSPISSPDAAVTVQDSDLQKLAAAVKLGAVNTGDVSKNVWAQQTPMAEKLLRGMCDCDQRNWLNHFVKTGHDAISGSQDYYQSVQVLAQLRFSNQATNVGQPAH